MTSGDQRNRGHFGAHGAAAARERAEPPRPAGFGGRWRAAACPSAAAVAGGWVLAILLVGCSRPAADRPPGGSDRAAPKGARLRDTAKTGDAVFANIVETLNDLDRAVHLRLRLPVVVLDASKSRDGKDVLATVSDNPTNPTGYFRYLHVPQGNAGFRKLGVRRGDRVRYFVSDPMLAAQIAVYQSSWFIRRVRQGQTTDPAVLERRVQEEMQRQAESSSRYVERGVRRVIDDASLLLEPGLPIEVRQPQRIEVWRDVDNRTREITQCVNRFIRGTSDPIAWEPSPDRAAIDRMVDRLNHWIRHRKAEGPWEPDPMVGTLPKALQQWASPEQLDGPTFTAADGQYLQQSVWLRDISRWARGESLNDLERAVTLFDWTVRNIQLESRSDPWQRPWHTLLYGRGNADERAWVFLLLCRQQGIDALLLERAEPPDAPGAPAWLPAVLSDGHFYLFEPRLGLPIPGPDGSGVATLAALRRDDRLLRQLDLDAEHPYRLKAADLRNVRALVAASPESLSRRMQWVEAHMSGDDRVVLTDHPTALAARIRQTGVVESVALWPVPFQTIQRQRSMNRSERRQAAEAFRVFTRQPALWKARVLHFAGKFNGDEGAKKYYRQARPSDAKIGKLPRGANPDVVRQAKLDASYWLGLLSYDDRQPIVSIDYLARRVLAVDREGRWKSGAQYNLGRAYEMAGDMEKARAAFLESPGPQHHGNALRAGRLKDKAAPDAWPKHPPEGA